jgi:transcriptional regulator of acetoin/glycerol metabolism
MDNEEDEIGSRCVGAPVFDGNWVVVAAISVAGPAGQIPNERIPELANSVKRTAARISAHLSSIGKRPGVQLAGAGTGSSSAATSAMTNDSPPQLEEG